MQEIIVNENEEIVFPVIWTGIEKELTYDIKLVGRGAKIIFLALLLGRESAQLKLKTNVIHQAAGTKSEIVIKSALTDSAQVFFDGLVKIEKGAVGTNAWLAAHVLLLSKKAKGITVPSLEILENEVKAGHATTVGRLSEKEIFYLMSRGISESQAKQLITYGFLRSLVERFPDEVRSLGEKELEKFGL